jgi:hypothetical protein
MTEKEDQEQMIVRLKKQFHIGFQGSNDDLQCDFCSTRLSPAPIFPGQRACLAESLPRKCGPCVSHSHLELTLERKCEMVFDGERKNCREKLGISSLVHAFEASQLLNSSKRRHGASDILYTSSKHATCVRHRGSWIPNKEGTRIFYTSKALGQKHYIFTAEQDSATRSFSAKDAKCDEKINKPKQYQCQTRGCQKSFTTSGHAARHSRIHTNYTVGCPIEGCFSTFTRADNCRQHQKIIHGRWA